MREIKFRGKRADNGRWVYGYYLAECGNHYIFERQRTETSKAGHAKVKPGTIGQFVGLKDQNGIEIYEGDIVSFERIVQEAAWPKPEIKKTFKGAVYFKNTEPYANFAVDVNGREYHIENACKGEIIGNFFDNPEPLEEHK